MKTFRSVGEIPQGFGPSAVTVGKFDGVHAGHRAIISELRRVASERGLESVVITFDRNPLETLAPKVCPESLVGLERKIALLADSGVEAALVAPFDDEFAALSAEVFVKQILVDALHARVVLIGSDFRFGARGAGNVDTLRELGRQYGFSIQLIDDVRRKGSRRVSSTWIRELLAAGDVSGAADLLNRVPSVRGVVVHGAKRGRALGFPTANLSAASDGLVPADGVYAGWLSVDGEKLPAAISVGDNPTFEGAQQKQVEAYVLDREIDLYDRTVEVSFVQRIRGMVAFDGVEPLIAQMRDDVERTREILRRERVLP